MHTTEHADAEVDLVVGVVSPSGHLVQAADLASEKLPMPQSLQAAATASTPEYVPAGQSVQDAAEAAEKVPAAHAVQLTPELSSCEK